jgi:regulator of sigma E protease
MSFLLFVAVLVVLIVAHELGHFFVAKWFGVRVDEFGVGYPPRAFVLGTIGETTYTLNWLPFGGFVKIFGEDPIQVQPNEKKRAMCHKPKHTQILILAAGVLANILLAWVLFATALYSGAPVGVPEEDAAGKSTSLVISSVVAASPADEAGLKSGDTIVGMTSGSDTLADRMPSHAARFIQTHPGKEVTVTFVRRDSPEPQTVSVKPSHGVNDAIPGTPAIGIRMALVSTEKTSLGDAIAIGARTTVATCVSVVSGLGQFLVSTVTGTANWSSVAGPVGIAVLIGDASAIGFVYLLQFMAFISVNLAVINLIPVPALDGGRIVFVLFEALFRRPIPNAVAVGINALGFVALIALMLVVTYHDIARIFT